MQNVSRTYDLVCSARTFELGADRRLHSRLCGGRVVRVIMALLAMASTAGVTTVLRSPPRSAVRIAGPSAPHGLSSLPMAAQGPVSAALGADDPSYRIDHGRSGLEAVNPAQGLTVSFGRSEVGVRSASSRLSVGLAAVGYGTTLHAIGRVAPQAHANRVTYPHTTVSEWYANGPLGLEEGFTISRPLPGNATSGLVTVALRLSGDLHPVLAQTDRGLILKTATGRAVLRYSGLIATDARGRTLPAWLSLAGDRVMIHVDTRGARYPLRIDPTFAEIAELTASNNDYNHLGGYDGKGDQSNSVAISGSTIVAGAPDQTIDGQTFQGAVYVFTEPASGWQNATQNAELTASDGAARDFLGDSVSISGSTVVAGAPGHGTTGSGAVYVYTEPASGWHDSTQTAELTGQGTSDSGPTELGWSVAISGNTIAAGSPEYSCCEWDDGYEGAVYLYSEPDTGWQNATQTALLISSEPLDSHTLHGSPSFGLGESVAIDGSTVAAGAPEWGDENTYSGGLPGAVYVFTEPAGGWEGTQTQEAELTASSGAGTSTGDPGVGVSVALAGSTIVSGAPYYGSAEQGATFIFVEPPSGWHNDTQMAELTASDGASGDLFGSSVDIDGSSIFVGAEGNGNGNGAVYTYSEPATGWQNSIENQKLIADHSGLLGASLAAVGSTVVAGAPYTEATGGPGAVFVFGPASLSNSGGGGSGSPPGGGSSPPHAPPALSNLGQSHSRWVEGNRLASLSRKREPKPPVGTTFSFVVNQVVRVSFAFAEQVSGRRAKGGKCAAETRQNRNRAMCMRSVSRGTLTLAGHAGSNKVFFDGRVSGSQKLALGSYTVTVSAVNSAGQRTGPQRLSFRIVK